ncbi:MAG TPA: transglycosylase domain-containing protein [Candidatus Paceibacterota bacterium]
MAEFRLKLSRKAWQRVKFLVIVALAAIFFGGGIFLVWASSLKMPDFKAFDERLVSQSTKIYDRTGKVLLYNLSQNIKRTVVPISDMSRHIKNATVAIEDSKFYEHHGFRPTSFIRAAFVNIISGRYNQGGSTITQQVVKNALLTGEKKLSRKLKELVLSLRLERILTKDQILEIYLNESPYGGTIYGVEEAAQSFFGKSASDVTLAEAAYLSALPQAPTYYSPNGNHKEELENRKNLVLKRMQELGFVTEEERMQAQTEKVSFVPREERNIKAPHFVMYVQEYLEQKYGADSLDELGLRVTTTLDWDLQQTAEEIVTDYGEQNVTKFNAHNAGMIAIDPGSGELLVMVGSRNYFDQENDGNFNVTLAHRQPGSAFKPFVYVTAFNKGYTGDTILFDVLTQFSTTCNAFGVPLRGNPESSCYMPRDFDLKFRGPMTLRNALAQSINIPAVKLLYLVGVRDSITTAQSLGITTLTDPDRYGLTMVLGGGEVTLLEMTGAYGVFANDGIRNPTTPILKITDASGKVLEEFKPDPKRALPQESARLISDILSDNEARAPMFGANSPMRFDNRSVAVKTGTTNDYRDAWIIGYTPNIAVGAWVGNNDNTAMEKKVAGYIVTPMWRGFLDQVLKDEPTERFSLPPPTPQDIKPILRGVWDQGDIHNILYYVDKNDPLGPPPVNPDDDSQFTNWEIAVKAWAQLVNIAPVFETIEAPVGLSVDEEQETH